MQNVRICKKIYYLKKPLGKGNFGEIYDAEDPKGNEVAIKIFSNTKDGRFQNKIERVFAKLISNKGCIHPNLICYKGWNVRGIVMEKMHGNLVSFPKIGDHIRKELYVYQTLKEMVGALKALRDVGVVHKDIKLENILWKKIGINEDGTPRMIFKLSDFGLSCTTKTKNLSKDIKDYVKCKTGDLTGTLLYISFEYIYFSERGEEYKLQSIYHDIKRDIWSLGLTMFFFWHRSRNSNPFTDVYFLDENGEYTLGIFTKLKNVSDLKERYSTMYELALDKEIDMDPTIEYYVNDTEDDVYIEKMVEALTGMLTIIPKERISLSKLVKLLH